MLNPVMFGYKENQRAGQKIAQALGCEWHYPGSGYRWQPDDLVVNWGNGRSLGLPQEAHILNKYSAVCRSVHKGITFEYLQNAGVSIPQRTSQRDIARLWLEAGITVFERHDLEGCNGAGIKIVQPGSELSLAPMYTKYVNNDREFRVHVFHGDVIFSTEKVLASDAGPNPNPMVKSGNDWSMGWVDTVPQCVLVEAVKATRALGLDFSAIDIGYKEGQDAYDETCFYEAAWVFESNTAPGAFGPVTTRKYVEAIKNACRV